MNEEPKEVQVSEEPAEQHVDLTGTEIVSNGEKIPTEDTKAEETKADEKEDQTSKKETDEKPPVEQEDFQKAKAEISDAKVELESKGIDFAKLEQEYNDNGGLSKESYKLLEDKGYPKALVEAALAGWQAKADAFSNKIIADAGGVREYERIKDFVKQQGAKAVAAFNEIVEKSDLNVVSAYIAGVKAQMVAKHGTDNPVLGGADAATKATGYADANEMVKAMSDPRYGNDPNYMKEVERKVAASKFF